MWSQLQRCPQVERTEGWLKETVVYMHVLDFMLCPTCQASKYDVDYLH